LRHSHAANQCSVTLADFHAIMHIQPSDSASWTARIEKRLGISPLRERGRPKVEKGSGK
jgi:hypothetical protein